MFCGSQLFMRGVACRPGPGLVMDFQEIRHRNPINMESTAFNWINQRELYFVAKQRPPVQQRKARCFVFFRFLFRPFLHILGYRYFSPREKFYPVKTADFPLRDRAHVSSAFVWGSASMFTLTLHTCALVSRNAPAGVNELFDWDIHTLVSLSVWARLKWSKSKGNECLLEVKSNDFCACPLASHSQNWDSILW